MKPGTVAVGFLDPGEWSACFGLSLVDLYLTDAHGPRRIVPDGRQLRKQAFAGGIAAGRNEVMARFLDLTECEWLWMIDTDMGFGPLTVEQLVAAADPNARPVVGGLCFKLEHVESAPFYGDRYAVVPTVFLWVDTDEHVGFTPVDPLPADALVEVAGTGAACLLVHRSVGETMRARFGDHWFDPAPHPNGTTVFSEDLSFCIRLAAIDVPVHVHTGVETTHHKGGIFLDRAAYESQRSSTSEPALVEVA